jgi:hypothetical protein
MDSNVTDVWSEVCRGYCRKTKPRGLNCSRVGLCLQGFIWRVKLLKTLNLDFACRVLFRARTERELVRGM